MIKEHIGNLLSVEQGILVQGVNCKSVMKSGIAKSIREKWSDVFAHYEELSNFHGLILGDIQSIYGCNYHNIIRSITGYKKSFQLPDDLIVVNAITQDDYGRDKKKVYADYDAIFAAFARIRIIARETKLPVHFPLIGCGLANGKWEVVSQLIEEALGPNVEKHLWVLPT